MPEPRAAPFYRAEQTTFLQRWRRAIFRAVVASKSPKNGEMFVFLSFDLIKFYICDGAHKIELIRALRSVRL